MPKISEINGTEEIGLVTPTPEQRTLKKNPTDSDGVQLTNAQCHTVPLSSLWYRESWTIQLKPNRKG